MKISIRFTYHAQLNLVHYSLMKLQQHEWLEGLQADYFDSVIEASTS